MRNIIRPAAGADDERLYEAGQLDSTWAITAAKRSGESPNVLLLLTYDSLKNKKYISKRPYKGTGEPGTFTPKLLSSGSIIHKVENWEGGSDFATCNVVIAQYEKNSTSSDILRLREEYKIINKEIELRAHFDGLDYSETKRIFKGKIASDTENNGKWTLRATDSRKRYSKNIPTKKYTTASYEYLQEGRENTDIPYLLGEVKGITPTLINTNIREFNISGLSLFSLGSVYDIKGDTVVISSDLDAATFRIDKNAFTTHETTAGANALAYITDTRFTTWVDNSPTASALDVPLTDPRYDTVEKLVNYIQSQPGYTASLICAGNIPSTKLLPVADVDMWNASFEAELRIPEHGEITCNAVGCKDTPNGTYTGTANGQIQQPGEWIHFIGASLSDIPANLIDSASFTTMRTVMEGIKFGNLIDTKKSTFDLMHQIAKEAYIWDFWDAEDNKLSVKDAEINLEEAVNDYYYEDKPFPRILVGGIKKETIDRDLYNKVVINYNYSQEAGLRLGELTVEDTISQSSVDGFGSVNERKIDADWIGEDQNAFSLDYTGTGIVSLEITGEGFDSEIRLKTHINGGGGETEFDFDLTTASYDTVRKVANKMNLNSDYVCNLKSTINGSLDSRGLKDIDNLSISKMKYVSEIGSIGSDINQFDKPQFLDLETSKIYISDGNNDRLEKYDLNLSWIATFGVTGSGNGQFKSPRGVYSDGTNIWVVDSGNSRVQKLVSATYTYSSQFGSSGTGDLQFTNPSGIDGNSNSLFICDTLNNRIQKVVKSSHVFASEVGSFGSGNSQFFWPLGIACNDNFVYVADTYNHRIQIFDTGLNFIDEFGSSGSNNGEFNRPSDVAMDDNNLYICDQNNARIQKFSRSNYNFITKIGIFGTTENDEFHVPVGIAASQDVSNLYICDQLNYRVKKYNKNAPLIPVYSPAKLLARKTLAQKKQPENRVQFDTSLYGLDQKLGSIIHTRKINETRDTRIRVTQVERKPNDYKVILTGRQEGVPLNNIIGRWQMTQTTGANAVDTSSNGYDLTVNSSPAQQGGSIIRLDGTDDYYTLSNANSGKLNIVGNNPFSIVGKIKFTGIAEASADGIISKTNLSPSRQWEIYIYNGLLWFQISNDGSTTTDAISQTNFTTEEKWRTFACIYTTFDMRIYINGVLDIGNISVNPKIYSGGIYSGGTAAFEIGRVFENNSNVFKGDMKYIAMLDIALTYEEVMSIHEHW